MTETGDVETNVITNDIGDKVDGSMDNDDEQLDTKDKAKEDCPLNENDTDESEDLTLKEDEAAGQDCQSNEHDDNAALASTESQSLTGLHASGTADQTLNEETPIQTRISNKQLTTSSVSDVRRVSQDDSAPNENPKEPPRELALNPVDDLQTQAKAQEPLEPVQESTSGACDQQKIETELKMSECDSHEPGTRVSHEVSDPYSQKTSARDDKEVESPTSPNAEHTLPCKNTNDLEEEVPASQNGARNNEKINDVRGSQKDEGDTQTTSNSKEPKKVLESKPRAREVGAAKEKSRSTESKISPLNTAGRQSPKSKADRSARPEVKANGSKANAQQDSSSRQHDAIALAARRSSGAGVSHAEAPRHTVAVASRVADLDRLARAARRNSLPLDRNAVHAAQLATRDAKLGVPHSAGGSAAAKDTRKRQKRTKTEIQVSHPAYNTVDRPLEPPQRARPRALSSESPASPVQETSSPPPQITLDVASKPTSSTRGSPQSTLDHRSRRAASPHSPNSPANDHSSPVRGGRKQHAARGEEKPRWRSPMSPQSPVSPLSGHRERVRSPPGLGNAESLDVADPVELKRLIVEEVKRTVRTQMARESRKDFEDKERKEKEHQVAEARKQAIAERQTQALQKLRQESDYLRKRNKDQEREIRRLQSVNTGLTRDIKVIVEEERRMAAIAIAEARNDLKRQLQHLMQEHNAQVEAMQNKIRHLELTQNSRHAQHQHAHQKHQYSELAEEKQHHSGEGLRNVGQDKRRARLLHLVDRAIASVEEIEVAPTSGHAGSLSPLSRKVKR